MPATAMIVSDDAIRTAGPLREDLFLYGEDVQWCCRIRCNTGDRIGVCAWVRFVHRASASTTRSVKRIESG